MSNYRIDLADVLSEHAMSDEKQRSIFALLSLGIIDSLVNGSISSSDAVERFFHADNCLFVHNYFCDHDAETLMSHGVQLPDLFLVLPAQEAQREFQRELAMMRSHCYAMLEEKELAF